MKSLRKSLNANKDSVRHHISAPTPLPSVSKPPSSILPPQKVIRALSPYHPSAPQELPFKKGDFFYVLRDVDHGGSWYEAHNPVTGARGLVPKDKFEEFGKGTGTLSRNNSTIDNTHQSSYPIPPPVAARPPAKAPKTFYAIVLHDFEAERADELDAKRGDAVTVVAQSNREWFVAKPIGRLGRPGLIPVSFVEIHDPTTGQPVPDVEALMDGGDLPRVEDWKRAMFNYKQNSISLGVIDSPNNRDSIPNSPFAPSPATSTIPKQDAFPDCLPDGILLSADVVSFHFEMEEYWFRIDAIFQPYPPPGVKRLPPAKHLILFRVYNDFYDFQVSLLNSFPREAGREEPHPRMLPYMPGPAQSVDDALTSTRRGELDEYMHSLCELSKVGIKYLLESQVVREFLSLKPGDVENTTEARVREVEELMNLDGPANGDLDDEIRDTLGRMRVEDHTERSDGSDYEDEGYAPSPQRKTQEQQKGPYDRHPYASASNGRRAADDGNLRLHAHAQNHNRTLSQSSINQRNSSPYSSNSRSNSPLERSSSPGHNQSRHHPSASTSSLRSSAPGTRSRSQSTAASTTAPAISSANPQTAFVKIKIFDRLSDDLIAIRVHPKVSHAELVEKVQTRLGGEVGALKYQDSAGEWAGLDTDYQLRTWIEGTDKHVLYAD